MTVQTPVEPPVEPPVRGVEVVVVVRRLARLKRWLVVVGVLAVLAGLVSAYHVSLAPPGLKARGFSYATATLDVVLDSRASTLSDANAALDPLVARAQVFAARLRSDDVQFALARDLGVPASDLALSSAKFGNPRSIAAATTAVSRANSLLFQGARYQVLIDAQTTVPVITINGLAPTLAGAQRLATGTEAQLQRLLNTTRAGIPKARQLVATGGRPAAGVVSTGSSWPVALVVTLLVFVALSLLLLLFANIFESLAFERGDG